MVDFNSWELARTSLVANTNNIPYVVHTIHIAMNHDAIKQVRYVSLSERGWLDFLINKFNFRDFPTGW
jgi:hypothetical protein